MSSSADSDDRYLILDGFLLSLPSSSPNQAPCPSSSLTTMHNSRRGQFSLLWLLSIAWLISLRDFFQRG